MVLKQAVALLVAFLLGLQFGSLRSLHDFSSVGHYELDTDDYLDSPDTSQIDAYMHTTSVNKVSEDKEQPPYLKWFTETPKIPYNWTYVAPLHASTPPIDMPDPTKKIIVHYHMQHNAGTNFFAVARTFTSATRACWQTFKHCSVSYNEEVEAENIRNNYFQHGLQYISYEYMLPPRFPMPFVSESAREGLFFTTILRNPMKRLISSARRAQYKPKKKGDPTSNFWHDVAGISGIYRRENLNVRWLSGTLDEVTSDHVNIAKCRLQLFDLVIVDTLYDAAVNDVVCPLNDWRGSLYCNPTKARKEYVSKKPNPFNETDSHFVGAWIERLRPSFELYDYARILSYLQLKDRGVKDIPELSEVPSYIETLAKYTNTVIDTPRGSQVSLRNINRFHPPKEFCDEMKQVWKSNPDEVPFIKGIGGLDPQQN